MFAVRATFVTPCVGQLGVSLNGTEQPQRRTSVGFVD
jgi:hypothetical protein